MFATTANLPKLSIREAGLSAAFALAAATLYTGLQYIAPTAFELASRVAAVAPQAIASGIKPFALAAWTPASYALPLLAVAFASRKVVALLNLEERLELSEKADSYVQIAVSNAAMCVVAYALAAPTLALAIAAVVWNVRTYQLTPAAPVEPKAKEDESNINNNNNNNNNNNINNNNSNNANSTSNNQEKQEVTT